MKNSNNRIRVAIQRKGRLQQASLDLLKNSRINLALREGELYCCSDNFPLDVLQVRDDDIPTLVAAGICDLGIVGTNVLQEKCLQQININKITILRYLGFADCRLSIAIPENISYQNIASLNQYRIATSYPNILREFSDKNNLAIDITTLAGSVEIAPRIGLADGICDLVATGATLKANQLQEVVTVFQSEAVLIKSASEISAEKAELILDFQYRMGGGL